MEAFFAAQMAESSCMQETWVWSLSRKDPLKEGMAIQSSILVWRIPWTEKPGRLQSTGSQRVGHSLAISTHIVIIKHWLFSLCCTMYPCSLFYALRFEPLSPLPCLASASFPLLTGNHSFVLYICESNAFLFISAILESKLGGNG